MPRPRPFTGHLVAPATAHSVVAPPYDSLTVEQRRAMAAADPESFLNALPAGPASPAELATSLEGCRQSVQRLIAAGHFTPLEGPVLAIVAIGSSSDRTVAIVGDLPVDAFDLEGTGTGGMVRPHERVDPTRVEQLARYLEVVGVASSPVAVAHRPSDAVTAAVRPLLERVPHLGFQGEDGVDIAVWIVDDAQEQARLADAVERAGTLYVADGHHRAAAVGAYAGRQGAGQQGAGQQGAGRQGPGRPRGARSRRGRGVGTASVEGLVLTAVIPSDHLVVLPFHRRVVGAPDASAEGVHSRLASLGEPVPLDGPWQPDRRGVIAVTAGGRWWSLDLTSRAQIGPVEGLDVRLIEREVFPVLLDGASPAWMWAAERPYIEPVAAPEGLQALERDDDTIGIALAPPGPEAIVEVADAGAAMPPKTTYVTPKLRSGIFLAPR